MILVELNKIKMDKEGYENYLKQIADLEKQLNETRLYKGKTAIFQGDNWHDNPELYQTEANERTLMQQISRMRDNIRNIEIVERNLDMNVVDIGDFVLLDIIYSDDDIEELYIKLVGGEANFKKEIPEISINSPLGKSIYQKNIGDKTSYQVNDNIFNVFIKDKNLESKEKKENGNSKKLTK